MNNSETVSILHEVKPERPWINRRQSLQEVARPVAISAAVATAIVLLTGLAGPLGFYVAFVLSFIVVSFIDGMRHDKVKAIDKVMTTLVTAGFASAFIPWASILLTVFKRGASAIYFGFFTNDMSITAADDELGMGGLSHALIKLVRYCLSSAASASF